ncbi:MAG: hypothetical protein Ta2E_10100 [Mycoplasmoidaceae bacterium]|nr:MAG: hypothetical protein Ta2E_10100 [Mycoplasmoidaceae bacterium]
MIPRKVKEHHYDLGISGSSLKPEERPVPTRNKKMKSKKKIFIIFEDLNVRVKDDQRAIFLGSEVITQNLPDSIKEVLQILNQLSR